MNQEPRTRAVVFDLDGLMFNTEDLYIEVGSQILARRGCRFTKALLDAMMGRPSPVALQIMIDWHQLDTTVAQLEAETDETFPGVLDAKLAPMPGLIDLLESLEQAKIPKAVATSSRRCFVTDVLDRFSMVERFQFILTAEDVVYGKPNPEIYLTACARLGVPAPEVLVLEDSQNGCRAAVDAKTCAVAVPSQHSKSHDFAGAAFVADSLSDVRIYRSLGL